MRSLCSRVLSKSVAQQSRGELGTSLIQQPWPAERQRKPLESNKLGCIIEDFKLNRTGKREDNPGIIVGAAAAELDAENPKRHGIVRQIS